MVIEYRTPSRMNSYGQVYDIHFPQLYVTPKDVTSHKINPMLDPCIEYLYLKLVAAILIMMHSYYLSYRQKKIFLAGPAIARVFCFH